MKLYLSSYGLGAHAEKLRALYGANKRCAVILNAQDLLEAEARNERVIRGMDEMRSIGLTPEELDLRDYFGKPDVLKKALQQYGGLWIRGGNVFVLCRAMRASGFDTAARALVKSGALVYAGFSAGSCAAMPNLHGIELVDDKDSVPPDYPLQDIVWEGLDFVDYIIAPHYKSDHPESADIDNVVAYLERNQVTYKTLHDGQAIVVDGDTSEVV